MISSLLETDLYKFSMQQAILHWFPKTIVKAEFKCRSDVKLGYLKDKVDKQLDELCKLRFSPDEIEYIRNIPWFTSDFPDYLERFYLKRNQIKTGVDETGQLTIVAEGPWRDVIHFEIPCLAIVSETYMKDLQNKLEIPDEQIYKQGYENLANFADKLTATYYNNETKFTLADFGLRRRFSQEWQDKVIEYMVMHAPSYFVGTSNVFLAKKYKIKPIGTFAHEWFQGIQGENIRLSETQKTALDIWAKEYRGELGIALSDIYGFNAFLKDFDKYFAKLFDGCRHDSGDPIIWGKKLIEHYKKLGIDPMTKTACWSDALDVDKCIHIAETFKNKIKISFGVGTNLTNNVGLKPLNMVMKLVESNGHPVCKLSDNLEKSMCHDNNFIEYCKEVFNYKSIDE